MRWLTRINFYSGAFVVFLAAKVASAVDFRVTIENLSPIGSVALSPFTVAAHDGTFDAFDAGSAASLGIEDVAELGDGTNLIAEIATAQPTAVTDTLTASVGGFGPGIFLPGASGSLVLSLDPSMHRYFTFGSMVVPSNDAFVGNDAPAGIELFDAGGNFVASNLTLTGNQIWDAGTEVNQLLGATYVVGQDAMDGEDENGVVHLANLATEFSPYLGVDVPSGDMFTVAPLGDTQIASISFEVVPEPAPLVLAGVGLVVIIGLWRKGHPLAG
jgi:hypothetical protein